MDKIHIEGLQVYSLIGVYDWEREAKQALLVDLVLFTDLQPAALSDKVADTLNYAEVAQCVQKVAAESEFELLEALANAMLCQVFALFPVDKISLKLSKPEILPDAQNVAVELTRNRAL
ncbi:MAG: dihydroneopterin aldolase [Paraglaciecola sp.]|jgi:dihydroneopterin aldolase